MERVIHVALLTIPMQNYLEMIARPLDIPNIKNPNHTSKVTLEATSVSIALEAKANHDSGVTITGQFIVSEQELPIWYDALVELWQDGRLKRFTVVDDTGAFKCKAEHTCNIRLVVISRDEQVVMFNEFNFPKQ